jgi:shikimate kinase
LYREVAGFVLDTGRTSVPTLVNLLHMQLELAGLNAKPAEGRSGA